MIFIKNKKEDAKLFSRYLIFAGLSKIVDIGLLFILTEYAKFWYFYSAVIAYIASIFPNFFLNKYYNFNNKNKKVFRQLLLFSTISITGLIINQAIMYVLVEYYNLWYMYAKFIAMVFVMFYNFYGNKFLTFRILK